MYGKTSDRVLGLRAVADGRGYPRYPQAVPVALAERCWAIPPRRLAGSTTRSTSAARRSVT
ncbi:hypothetical protein LN650_13145 [Klebsiella pneumoniae subsp. pneumoniae]|nr:hypothetical protein [Klebsiella pneumoniae subsp. pneumoniae]